jgi:hypothetical protein
VTPPPRRRACGSSARPICAANATRHCPRREDLVELQGRDTESAVSTSALSTLACVD